MAKKKFTKDDVDKWLAEIGAFLKGARDARSRGKYLNADPRYLERILEQGRRIVIQLGRPRRDYS